MQIMRSGVTIYGPNGLSNVFQAEDAAHTSGEYVLPAGVVRKDTAVTLAGTDGDYTMLITDGSGKLHVAGYSVGDIAHDAVDSGSPVKIGGYAVTALPTAVANADRTNIITDKFGRQVVLPGTVRDLIGTQTTTISASTSETTIVTAAASVFNDLFALVISNTSASTTTRIDFRDDTAGTVMFSLHSAAKSVVGFALPGFSIPQTAVNKNWTAQCGTSTTDIRILAIFEKNR